MHAKTVKALSFSIGIIVIGAIVGFGIYSYRHIHKLRAENADLKTALQSTQNDLSEAQNEKLTLNSQLMNAQETLTTFEGQIATITSAVGTLQKLSQTDPELLKKYSKIYFLNENYHPAGLTVIDPQYVYVKDKQLQYLSNAWPFLQKLLNTALYDGMNLKIVSAYRSFSTQGNLKSSYKVTYGAGTANQFSAEQGYSEHQLGTAVDFTTLKVGSSFVGFEKTAEYMWLTNNAYKFGFILSYPQHNSYYIYEPWHWRFVGVALATKLHNENKYFYNLDQREIDGYLVHLFDQ